MHNGFRLLLRRLWWIPPATMLLGLAIAAAITAALPRLYTATATLFVGSTGGTSSIESYQGGEFSAQRTESYVHILTSETLGKRVADVLDLPFSGAQMAAKVGATAVPKTVLIEVSVTDGSAVRAATIANAYATQFIEYVTPLETPTGQAKPRVTVQTIGPAEAPQRASSPQWTDNLIYGGMAGLALGIAILVAMHLADSRVRDPAMLTEVTGLPTLGPVRVEPRKPGKRKAQLRSWDTPEAEAFRKARVQLQALGADRSVFIVTGADDGVDTTGVALDLAVAFAETGRATVLLSIGPTAALSEVGLPVSAEPGLSDLVEGRVAPDEIVQRTLHPRLFVVVGGPDVDGCLATLRAADTIGWLVRSFRYVVIATPPVGSSSAAAVLSQENSATVLAVHRSVARRREVRQAARELAYSPAAPVAGLLVD